MSQVLLFQMKGGSLEGPTMSQSCWISQNLFQSQLFLSLRLFLEASPEEFLKFLKSCLVIDEFCSSQHSESFSSTSLLSFSPTRLPSLVNPTMKLHPHEKPFRLRLLIQAAQQAQSLHSESIPSSPHLLLPHTHTSPFLLSRPKFCPIVTDSPPRRKLILVGYLNTPKPPLPHKYHSPLIVRAAQQFPPQILTISSSMESFLGTETSFSCPRPSWQLWFTPVPQTPLEVTKREYLAPANTKVAGQTLSQ